MRRHASIVLGLALLLGTETRARAQGGSPDQARRAFEEGVALEKKADYASALGRFRDAARIKATPGVRFHEGYCLEMTGKLAQALETYEQAEKLAREQNKADVLSAVRARLEPLAPRVPQLAIRVDPKEAEVRVDGIATTKDTVRVDPGEHEIAATARDRTPKQVRVTAKEGATETVVLELEPIAKPQAAAVPAPAATPAPSPSPATTEEPPREEPPSRSIALPLVVTGGALVLAGAGIGAFVVSGSTQEDADRECQTRISCESERDKVRTLDALALAGFVGAAGLGALAIVLWSSGSTKVTTSGSAVQLTGRF